MCGIYFSVACNANALQPNDVLHQRLKYRGPDAHGSRSNANCFPGRGWIATHIEGTVLSLRGSDLVGQPIVHGLNDTSEDDFVLCWNGEAWTIDDEPVVGNDAQTVSKLMFQMLAMCSRSRSGSHTAHHLVEVLARIRGPYAFVLVDTRSHRCYFARDCLGRRSLLFKATTNAFILSSVGDSSEGWIEVDANQMYALDWNPGLIKARADGVDAEDEITVASSIKSFDLPFNIQAIAFPWSRDLLTLNSVLPASAVPPLTWESQSVCDLHDLLKQSLQHRLNLEGKLKPTDALDTSRLAILFSGGLDCTVLARLVNEILPPREPIDLLNVAFQNPRIHGESLSSDDAAPYETCPDRITARKSYAELQVACPQRLWRLVIVNVPFVESQAHRHIVLSLMQPHGTEMDLSIGLALYFAARGVGMVDGSPGIPYETPARVLLSGLGADELFGGYQRHATAFTRGGFGALTAELALDTGRLGKRNLGRDDRIIAHWGKEVRYSYLDESLLRWAAKTPVWKKCGFGQDSGRTAAVNGPSHVHESNEGVKDLEPGKLVLRLLARKLGLPNVAGEKKRAIQFGARTAKMERRKTKGTDVVGVRI